MSLSFYGLQLFFSLQLKVYKEVQRFSWKEEETSYYNIVCCCAIVFGILASVYVANEEEENER